MASKLEQGIEILYNMELNNYFMTIAIQNLDAAIYKLGIPKKIIRPTEKKNDFKIYKAVCGTAFVCAIIGAIIRAIIEFANRSGFFWKIAYAIAGLIVGIIYGALIGIPLGIIIGFIIKSIKSSENKEKYANEIKNFDRKTAEESIRIKKENKQKEILISQRNALINRKKEATIKLNQFYQIMRIDTQYRNIVPIGYMYEFMRLGISAKLEGADGLYYLIRQELRADQMQRSLEDISSKLDTIISNQHQLHNELVSLNSKCNTLINETKKSAELAAKNNQLLKSAVTNTSISAYNSQRIKEELIYQNFMLTYGK